MATIVVEAFETLVAFGSGGYVAKTALIINIILAIHAALPIKLRFRP